MLLLFLLAIAAGAAYFFLPCPDPNPPPGFLQQWTEATGILFWLTCAIYSLIPLKNFNDASAMLGFVVPGFLIVVYTAYGHLPHVLFLTMEVAWAFVICGLGNLFVTAAFEADGRTTVGYYWLNRGLLAFFGGFLAKAQTIDFVRSLC